MKAKCPHCENGCEKCKAGFVEATIAEGDVYSEICHACGQRNGCFILGPNGGKKLPEGLMCVFCGKPSVWELVGVSSGGS